MLIDFDKIEEQHQQAVRGGEGELIAKGFADDYCKFTYGRLKPGNTIGYHQHITNCEAIYIISGTADFLYDDGSETVSAGGCHYCPKGHFHSMRNFGTEDVVFFAVIPELKEN